nr:uncharacterized protein LOC128690516 isoform X1 [Cherax quadricarinatus]
MKFGRQSWLFLAIVTTELLIVVKFGWETVTIPFPSTTINFSTSMSTIHLSPVGPQHNSPQSSTNTSTHNLSHVVTLWMTIFIILVLWTLWNFYIDPHTFKVDSEDVERRREHWSQVRAIETKLSPSESRLFISEFFFDKILQKETKKD